jgi:hypothetical protein
MAELFETMNVEHENIGAIEVGRERQVLNLSEHRLQVKRLSLALEYPYRKEDSHE